MEKLHLLHATSEVIKVKMKRLLILFFKFFISVIERSILNKLLYENVKGKRYVDTFKGEIEIRAAKQELKNTDQI